LAPGSGRFDIFEALPCGGLWWCASCPDTDEVNRKLAELGKSSSNEFYAKDTETGQVIARVNEAGTPPSRA
jgi:hypothetical protein